MIEFSSSTVRATPGQEITITCKLKNTSGAAIKYWAVAVGVDERSFPDSTGNRFDEVYVVGGAVTQASISWKANATKTFTWTFVVPESASELFELHQTRIAPLKIWFVTGATANSLGNDTYITDLSALAIIDAFCTPQVEDFQVVRTPDDESSTVAVTIKLSQSEAADSNALWAPTCRLVYAADGYGGATTVDLTDRIADLLTGITADTTIVTGDIDPAYDYDFVLSFGDSVEEAIGYTDVPNATAPFALSETGEGAAFGMFPTGNAWLESDYPIVPYNGIAGVNIYMPDVVLNKFIELGGVWIEDGIAKPIHRITVTFEAMAKDAEQLIDIGIPGDTVERIVSIDGMFDAGGGAWMSLMYSNDAGVGYHVRTAVINAGVAGSNLMLRLITGASRTIERGHATIAYIPVTEESD